MASGFFRGANSFWVGKMMPNEMLAIYRYTDRTIWVQPLPLTAEQKRQVIAKLEYDILDDHKYYAYDHFGDNCTTRIRDILDHATGGALSSMQEPSDGRTFRDLARDGVLRRGHRGARTAARPPDHRYRRWAASTDRVPTLLRAAYSCPVFPRGGAKTLGHPADSDLRATRVSGCRPERRTAAKGCVERGAPYVDGPSGRVLFALFILLATATAWATKLWGRFQHRARDRDRAPNLLGLVMWFLAIISPLPYVHVNETCLVLFPFDLLVLLPILSPERKSLYARGRVAMLGLVTALHLVGLLHQPLIAPILWPLIPLLVVCAAVDSPHGEAPVCVVVGVGPGNGASFARRFAADGYAIALLAATKAFSSSSRQRCRTRGRGRATSRTPGRSRPRSPRFARRSVRPKMISCTTRTAAWFGTFDARPARPTSSRRRRVNALGDTAVRKQIAPATRNRQARIRDRRRDDARVRATVDYRAGAADRAAPRCRCARRAIPQLISTRRKMRLSSGLQYPTSDCVATGAPSAGVAADSASRPLAELDPHSGDRRRDREHHGNDRDTHRDHGLPPMSEPSRTAWSPACRMA